MASSTTANPSCTCNTQTTCNHDNGMIGLAQLPGTVQSQPVPNSAANIINSHQPQTTRVNLAVSGNINASSTTLSPASTHLPAFSNPPRSGGEKWWSKHHLTARGAGWSAVFLGVLGLWIAFQSLHETKKANILAAYANQASFRDDCRAQNDTGYDISNACQEALAKPLPPPHRARDIVPGDSMDKLHDILTLTDLFLASFMLCMALVVYFLLIYLHVHAWPISCFSLISLLLARFLHNQSFNSHSAESSGSSTWVGHDVARDAKHSVSQTYTVWLPLPVKGDEIVYTASTTDSTNSTDHVPLRRSHEGRFSSRHSKGNDLDHLSDWRETGQDIILKRAADSACSFVSVGSWAIDEPRYDSQQIKNQDLRFVDELLKMKIAAERYEQYLYDQGVWNHDAKSLFNPTSRPLAQTADTEPWNHRLFRHDSDDKEAQSSSHDYPTFSKTANSLYMECWQDGMDIWMPRWEGSTATEYVASVNDTLMQQSERYGDQSQDDKCVRKEFEYRTPIERRLQKSDVHPFRRSKKNIHRRNSSPHYAAGWQTSKQ